MSPTVDLLKRPAAGPALPEAPEALLAAVGAPVHTEPQLREVADLPPDVIQLSHVSTARMADEWYEYASPEHFWFQWRFAAIRELLPPAGPAAPVLEIGCGNGVARGQIEAAFGCEVHGCDINVEALRRGSPGRGQRYLYNVHDRRPAWRGHFGTVFLLDTLEHLPDAPGFLRSVAHHLGPGGTLLITVPAGQWVFSRYDRLVGHVKRYSARLLRRELAAAGLQLLRHQYWGLTLLPVLAARKAVLACAPRQAVVRTGFQPASPLVDSVLRRLMWIERGLFPRPFYGAALVGVAGKARQA